MALVTAVFGAVNAAAQPFSISLSRPSMDRWMYPFNATPGTRPSAPVFGTFGDDAGVDSRHGQFIIGFDLASELPPGFGASRYLIRSARLSVTVNRDQSFALDPTRERFGSWFPEDDPLYEPDDDLGRPVELFGTGFRNGFTAATFEENAPFGGATAGERNAFAVGYNTRGELVDVGNNVGKTNFPPFETRAFAVGDVQGLAPGERVPSGATMVFEIDVSDPFVARYLQEACDSGRLRLTLTSLHVSEFGGSPEWPEFFTSDSPLGAAPSLFLEATVVRDDDLDSDGLPDDWELFHFGETTAAPDDDPDGDGATTLLEWKSGTIPTDSESSPFLAVSRDVAGARMNLQFSHAPGWSYVIESSSDLLAWEAEASAEIRYYVVSHRVAQAVAPMNPAPAAPRFFRVRGTAPPGSQP